jgi:predicted transcriptional regulator
MPSEIVFLTAQIIRSIASETKLSPQEMVALIKNVYAILHGLDRSVDAPGQNPTVIFPD